MQVALPGWAPAPHWRVLVAAVTRAVPGDAYWVDNLQLDSASLLSSAEIASPVSLEVSLNGQDYSALGFRYSYLSQPQISALLPPGGPLGGDTRVRVAGSGLRGGSGYACRFGEVRVHASWDEAAGEVVCVTPPQPGHAPAGGSLPFAIALNVADADHPDPLAAADFTLAAPEFTYHGPLTCCPAPLRSPLPSRRTVCVPGPCCRPHRLPLPWPHTMLPLPSSGELQLTDVSPAVGPVVGGAVLAVHGGRMAGGSDYLCCLAAEGQTCTPSATPSGAAGGGVGPATSAASYDAATATLRCVSPAVQAAGAHRLRLSLNGQQFAWGPGQALAFWAVAPLALLASLLPAAGPAEGGSVVVAALSSAIARPNPAEFAALFSGSSAANLGAIALEPTCRFGGQGHAAGLVVPATLDGEGRKYTCVTPSAAASGAALELRPTTEAELRASLTFYGGAAPIGGGAVRLSGPPGQEAGSIVVSMPQPLQPLPSFVWSAELTLRSHASLDGVSLSYGDNLGRLRQFGKGHGLRVVLLPLRNEIVALLQGVAVGAAPLLPNALPPPAPYVSMEHATAEQKASALRARDTAGWADLAILPWDVDGKQAAGPMEGETAGAGPAAGPAEGAAEEMAHLARTRVDREAAARGALSQPRSWEVSVTPSPLDGDADAATLIVSLGGAVRLRQPSPPPLLLPFAFPPGPDPDPDPDY